MNPGGRKERERKGERKGERREEEREWGEREEGGREKR